MNRSTGLLMGALSGLLIMNACSADADPPPSIENSSSALSTEAQALQKRFGSRFLCEVSRSNTIMMSSLVGSCAGMFGGYAGGRALDGAYAVPLYATLGIALGAVIGWGAGAVAGRWIAPDCSPLGWTDDSKEKMRRYRTAENAYTVCMEQNRLTDLKWSGGGFLIGGLVGAAVAAVAGRGGESLNAGGLLVILSGAGIGGAIGTVVAMVKKRPCGVPPRAEDYEWGTVPAPATSGPPATP